MDTYGVHNSGVAEREVVIRQLKRSGVQYSLRFIGTVGVRTSMNELPAKCQEDVALASIKMVVGEARLLDNVAAQSDLIGSEHIEGSVRPTIYNCRVDLNVCSRWILLVESSVRKVRRFSIRDISIAYPGHDNLRAFFCFIAKSPIDNRRKCFVFHGGAETHEVYNCLTLAFELSYDELQIHQMSDGNSGPYVPPEHALTPEFRQGIASQLLPTPTINVAQPRPNTTHSLLTTGNDIGTPQAMRDRSRSASGQDGIAEVTREQREAITAGLFEASWFHHTMTREEAERHLRTDGQFLVRQSPNAGNAWHGMQFVLSGRYKGRVEHMCIVGPKGRISSDRGPFTSIVELIEWYMRSGEELSSKSNSHSTLKLENPITSSGQQRLVYKEGLQ